MKPIIEVDAISKLYVIGHQKQVSDTLKDTLAKAARKPLAVFTGQKLDHEQLWALKDVSFQVQQGEIIGVIGRNGSGKSTMLKILSRITEPTSGKAVLRGRIASLLEVGTGFHPELTGRENIFLNGAILGMTKKEILKKFDEIVAFSGVEKFLDTPVKFYSSGMYVRLAFSVAAHLEPDVLIVDEVLAVGDVDFQEKSLGKMKDVTRDRTRTVIFVSHNLTAIQSICTRAIVLDKGKLVFDGDTKKAINHYLGNSATASGFVKFDAKRDTKNLKFISVGLCDESNKQRGEFANGENIDVRLDYQVTTPGKDYEIVMELWNEDGVCVLATSNYDRHPDRNSEEIKPGKYAASFTIPTKEFREGSYYLSFGASIPGIQMLDEIHHAIAFKIASENEDIKRFGQGRLGTIYKEIEWRITKNK
jgi:lipopolysaccharide transport system ATP-binding protein